MGSQSTNGEWGVGVVAIWTLPTSETDGFLCDGECFFLTLKRVDLELIVFVF